MRISSKGQITIPREIRESTGLLPYTEVEFIVKGNAVQIVRSSKGVTRGARIVQRLRQSVSPRMSTDEIMKLTRG